MRSDGSRTAPANTSTFFHLHSIRRTDGDRQVPVDDLIVDTCYGSGGFLAPGVLTQYKCAAGLQMELFYTHEQASGFCFLPTAISSHLLPTPGEHSSPLRLIILHMLLLLPLPIP